MINIYKYIKEVLLLSIILVLVVGSAQAQMTTMGSAYYMNKYQVNPAAAGQESGTYRFNMSYRKEASSIDESAGIQTFTADYGYQDNMGLGVNLYREKAGLIEYVRAMATYAYHMSLSETQKISFGLSAGVISQQIDVNDIQGDAGDPNVAAFNDEGITFDVDFGVHYNYKSWDVEAVALHIPSYMADDEEVTMLRKPTYYGAVSYSFPLSSSGGVSLAPKVCYRKVDGYDEIVDIGAKAGFLQEALDFYIMYHTSQNATLGASFEVINRLRFGAMYTTDAVDYDGMAGSDYEFTLLVNFD